MQTSSGIQDKVVVITGASSGIGEATALLLAERGAKVVLGARGLERLKDLADRIAKAGGEAAYAPTDVKRRGDLSNLVKLACERYGRHRNTDVLAVVIGHSRSANDAPEEAAYDSSAYAVWFWRKKKPIKPKNNPAWPSQLRELVPG